jgi:AAA15 family ATPase/GTPase
MQTVFFPANAATAARETAARFSSLSKSNEETALVDEMRRLFPNINSVSVELEAGVPMVFIGLRGNKEKMPVNLISGGTNRVTSILLALAASPGGAVIIDEIDNGIFHSRMTGVWAATLALAKKYKTQVFASTHDLECLEALVTAAKEDLQDVGLWRLEQTQEGPSLLQFSGEDLKASIDYGAEVRGGEDSGRS